MLIRVCRIHGRMDHPLRWSSEDYGPIEARSAWLSLFSERIHEVVRDPGRRTQSLPGPHRAVHARADHRELSLSRTGAICRRTKSVIAKSRHDNFVLVQPRTGKASFRLAHGEVTAKPARVPVRQLIRTSRLPGSGADHHRRPHAAEAVVVAMAAAPGTLPFACSRRTMRAGARRCVLWSARSSPLPLPGSRFRRCPSRRTSRP